MMEIRARAFLLVVDVSDAGCQGWLKRPMWQYFSCELHPVVVSRVVCDSVTSIVKGKIVVWDLSCHSS